MGSGTAQGIVCLFDSKKSVFGIARDNHFVDARLGQTDE